MLRPDTSFIYERGMGAARCVPLDKAPGQKADVPWIRDTFIMLGHDGNYYLTGTYDMMYSCARKLDGPWKPRRVAVPHAGHGALFQEKSGRWNASFFGNDRTAPFRAMPGYVPVRVKDTGEDRMVSPAVAIINGSLLGQ